MRPQMLHPDIKVHIALSRERKARLYARYLWETQLVPGDRAAGIEMIQRAPAAWWKLLASRLDQRVPGPETRALIIEKLQDAHARRMD